MVDSRAGLPRVDADAAAATARGTASDVVLAMYDRIPVDSLRIDGDRRLIDQVWSWNPAR